MSPNVALGFYGKLPSRGDFLRGGLPRSFTDPWDAWLQGCLTDSRARLGEAWVLCWLEAPVWRFALAPGVCGPNAAAGLWVPSVDRVGRDFPLTLAAIGPDPDQVRALAATWLDVAEAAACDAVTAALEPDILAAALLHMGEPTAIPDTAGGAAWWTQGAPRVPATRLVTPGLPSRATFVAMLDSPPELESGEAA